MQTFHTPFLLSMLTFFDINFNVQQDKNILFFCKRTKISSLKQNRIFFHVLRIYISKAKSSRNCLVYKTREMAKLLKTLAIIWGSCNLVPSFSFVRGRCEFCNFFLRSSKTSHRLPLLKTIPKHNYIRFLLNEGIVTRISKLNEVKFLDSSILIRNFFNTSYKIF